MEGQEINPLEYLPEIIYGLKEEGFSTKIQLDDYSQIEGITVLGEYWFEGFPENTIDYHVLLAVQDEYGKRGFVLEKISDLDNYSELKMKISDGIAA